MKNIELTMKYLCLPLLSESIAHIDPDVSQKCRETVPFPFGVS